MKQKTLIMLLSNVLKIKSPDVSYIPYDPNIFCTSTTIAVSECSTNTIYINATMIKDNDIEPLLVLSVLFHELKHIEQYQHQGTIIDYRSSDRLKDLNDYYLQPLELDATIFQEISTKLILGFSWMELSSGLDKVVKKVNEEIKNNPEYQLLVEKIYNLSETINQNRIKLV